MRWRPLVLLLFGFAASLLAAPPPSLLSAPAAPRVGSLAAAALAADPADSDISHRGGYQLVSLLPSRVVRLQGAPASWVAAFESVRLQDGNNSSRTNALGETTTTTYVPGTDYVQSTTDALGHTTTFFRDARGKPLTITDPLGQVYRFTYNAFGQVTSTSQRLRQADGMLGVERVVTRATFDGAGRAVRSEDAAGNATVYAYGTNGRPISESSTIAVVLADGSNSTQAITTRYAWTAQGNLGSLTDASGAVTTLEHDANGNVTRQVQTRTLADGSTETLSTGFRFDAQNRLIWKDLPDGQAVEMVYAANGFPASRTDWSAPKLDGTRESRTTTFEVNARGDTTRVLYPDGTSEVTNLDAEGRILSEIGRSGRTTLFGYDAIGRMTRVSGPGGMSLSREYDAMGRETAVIDERGAITRYAYDAIGRQRSVTAAAVEGVSEVTTFTYGDGNLVRVTDALGRSVQYAYDLLDRPTHTTQSDGTFTQTTYDAAGRRTSERNALGQVTRYGHNPLGRIAFVVDPTGATTRYEYDEVGNLVRQSDGSTPARTTTFAYDAAGRRVSRRLPGGETETMAYTPWGALERHTDFNGTATTFEYEPVTNRLARRIPGNGEAPVAFQYYPDGARLSMSDALGTTTYQYDVRGRLAQRNTPIGTVSYDYTGSRVSRIRTNHTNGADLRFTHDAVGRLSTVDAAGFGMTGYSYNAVGGLSGQLLPNGLHTAYGYDAQDRLTSLETARFGLPQVIAQYRTTRDALGRRSSVTEAIAGQASRTVAWDYDTVSRLRQETITGGTISGIAAYTHDAVGNRLSRLVTGSLRTRLDDQTGLTYDANDRQQGGGHQYDANGSALVSQVHGVGTVTDAYTSDRRLRERTNPDGSRVVLTYDGDGHKVAETVIPAGGGAGTTTYFLVETLNPTGYAQTLEELSPAQVVLKRYAIGRDVIGQQTFTMQADGTAPRILFVGADDHGNVRYLSDASGELVGFRDYDAFGVPLTVTGASLAECRLTSGGEEWCVPLGQQYLRTRTYDPNHGRFTTRDSFEGIATDPGSLHAYAYTQGDPVNYTDPSGYMKKARWHHLLPKTFYDRYWKKAKMPINDADFGHIMEQADHSALHSAGWNDEWESWLEQADQEGRLNDKNIRKKLSQMKAKPQYAQYLKKGVPAKWSYHTWRFKGAAKLGKALGIAGAVIGAAAWLAYANPDKINEMYLAFAGANDEADFLVVAILTFADIDPLGGYGVLYGGAAAFSSPQQALKVDGKIRVGTYGTQTTPSGFGGYAGV